MGKFVRVARVPTATGVPEIVAAPQKSTATFIRGALLVMASGEVDECGANPASIYGVALQGADTNPGYDAANSPTVITGRSQTVSVARANRTTVFSAPLTNNSSAYVAPATADIGASYGVTAYSGEWTVDKNKTAGDARVVIQDIDTDNNLVLFRVLEANIQP